MEEDLARAFGLWWAEGDSKTTREITFTNNCFELVEFFYEVIWDFSNLDNFRLYIYRPSENSNFQTLDDCNIRYYEDNRASQTYYILRIASTTLVEKWRSHVDSLKNDESLFRFILQGIFAGEGSVVQSSKRSRTLKISQGCRSEFLENIMDHFFTDYYFRQENRTYNITKKKNWDAADTIDLAKMHPRKRKKFDEIYQSYVEEHYPRNYLKNEVYDLLSDPWMTRELASKFDRSQARLCDVLMELKQEDKIQDFKSGSHSYWIRKDENSVIISEKKKEYLELLNSNPIKVGEISQYFGVRKSSAYKHLKRLQEMGLIEKKNHRWMKNRSDKDVIVL